jgi:plasmid stabilization system protein ParE
MRYSVRFTARAKRAIDDYIDYIAHEKQGPINAGRVLGAIENAIDTLEAMPHRCPKAPEDAAVDYTVRMLIVKKTLIILYRIDKEAKLVTVIGFRHGRQTPVQFD